MRFEWNDAKNQTNLAKHKVSVDTASCVFDDPLALSVLDRTVNGEERWITSGMIDNVLLIVAHTWSDHDGDEVIRLISARKATRSERQTHEQHQRRPRK